MRLLMLVQRARSPLMEGASWGQRKLQFIREHAPQDWEIQEYRLPAALPAIIDDPTEFVPEDLSPCDLLLALSEDPGVAELIPDFAQASDAQGVIAPIDNRAWLPLGLQKQVARKLEAAGVDAAFPAPFCTLQEDDVENLFIAAFARRFGRPALRIACAEGKVESVQVGRVAPCGNTTYVAENLSGTSIRDAATRAGLLHHHFPCWASMDMDEQIGDTLMHQGGLMIKLAVEEALRESD